MYTGGSAYGPCAQRPAATTASSPDGWSVFMSAPTRLCLSTCAPGGPGLPTGNAATSLPVKTVRSNPKGHSANFPKAIGYRGRSPGLSLNTGRWIKFLKDCELGPELDILSEVHGYVQGHVYTCSGHKRCQDMLQGASTVFILGSERVKGWIKLASNSPAVNMAGAHKGSLNSGSQGLGS